MRRLWRVMPFFGLGLAAVLAARCGKPSGGGGPAPMARCEADLTKWEAKGGSGAFAKEATTSDLLLGEAATGRAGDVLLKNDRIQLVIEQAERVIGPQPYGGDIIDADTVHAGASHDRFGELGSMFQFGRTVGTERVEILADGSKGGPAIVAATGPDKADDFIHLAGLIGQYLPGISIPNADADLHLRITKYYVLNPGEESVKVVDAYCNDAKEPEAFQVGDLVDSGGQVEIYGGAGGFAAAGDLNPSQLAGALGGAKGQPFSGWLGKDVSYGLIPETEDNTAVTISGVTAMVDGSTSILDWTNRDDSAGGPPPTGALIVAPGKPATLERDFVVSATTSGLYDAYYRLHGKKTGTVEGEVDDADGHPKAGVRVIALQGTDISSLFTTGDDGRFTGQVPVGATTFQADDGVTRSAIATATIGSDAQTVKLALEPEGSIAVHIRDVDGHASPGKVTVLCDGACTPKRSDAAAGLFRDVTTDGTPDNENVFSYSYVDPTGEVTIPVPAGTFHVVVSRGLEFSLTREDVTVDADQTSELTASLAHEVDTTGWMSGDFHVHAIDSPDSPLPNVLRLVSFMAEGLDVAVSTDHDYITDFAPFLKQIPNGQEFMTTIPGEELTTFDYGHYNGFPLSVDTKSRNGGAIDWAGGKQQGMTPGDIFQALAKHGTGERVVQVNHARSGLFNSFQIDTRTLWTRVKPEAYRIRHVAPDPATGDTRMFDPNFTALEIQNGMGPNFFPLMNDWMSLLSRGIVKTATAVSDSHHLHGEAGYPRTFVHVGEDDVTKLDVPKFVHAINQHEAIGTNGPFVTMTATAGGEPTEIGGTLVSNGQPVTVTVTVRTPDWMEANDVQIFVNATGTETQGDDLASPTTLPTPAQDLALDSSLVDFGGGQMRVGTATYTFTPEKDAWIVAVVTGTKDMFPVVGKGGIAPRAYTNPIFVDVDGKGWTPPVDLAAERARVGHVPPVSQPLSRPATEQELRRVLAHGECGAE